MKMSYKKMLLGVLCILSIALPSPSFAVVSGVLGGFDATYSPCAKGGKDVKEDSHYGGCVWNTDDPDMRAQVLWGAGQKWSPGSGQPRVFGLENAYPPFTANYSMRVHFCPSTGSGICTIGSSAQTLDSVSTQLMHSTHAIASESDQYNFRGYSGVVSSASNACYTMVDPTGVEWASSSTPYMCQDANILPTVPATCYLNDGADLNVDMGNLERSTIATIPASSAAGNIKKEIDVLCTRDAGVTVSTTFQFTPISISGSEVASTSTPYLGVAIFYEGKLVTPSSEPLIETFELGHTSRELEFQAVRDPNTALKDISSGDFNASVVMVMTEK